MSKIETATSAPGETVRELRDHELDAVSGGIIVEWMQRGIVIEGSTPAGNAEIRAYGGWPCAR
jgi:hypothetical protein